MITEQQIKNLRLGADYLDTVEQEKFDMDDYLTNGVSSKTIQIEKHECGSVGCAIGSCAISGIPSLSPLSVDSNWDEYEERVFGLPYIDRRFFSPLSESKISAWSYCFSAMWEEYDNTPTGAASRMREVADYYEKQLNNQ